MSFVGSSDELPAWVGRLPTGWESNWLKWSVNLCIDRPTDLEQERLPYISNEDIESWTGRLINGDPQPTEADSRVFKVNDVLLNKLRPYLAKVYHAQFDGVSSGELLCIRPAKSVVPRFLFYVLSSRGFIDAIDAATFGSKMPRADWEIVGHQPLPLPPFETQQRITQFLDEKTAQIDKLIAKKRALLDRLAEQRQALITHAVTKGLNPHTPLKPSGIDCLGDIPAHWEVVPLRRIAAKVATGRTPPSTGEDYFYEGEINWFTPGDFGQGIEIEQSVRKLTAEAIHDGVSTLFPPGTVFLVGIGATLGKVAVSSRESSANQQLTAIVLKNGISSHFTAYYLHGFREIVRVASNGNTLAILNQDGTKALTILKAPADEQVEISDFLTERDRNYFQKTELIQESISRLDEYRSALVASAVTGQIAGLQ